MEIPKIYKDSDADISLIKSKKVGIVGFGNQGRAQALNLRDSGVDVWIGVREGSKSRKLIESDGLHWCSISEILESCDIIALLVPDQVVGKVYRTHIATNLQEGQTLLFAHGYNIHYNVIIPPEFINVVMAAPSGAGTELRKQFKKGKGIPGLFAIYQDYSKDSRDVVLSYCKAVHPILHQRNFKIDEKKSSVNSWDT